MSVVAQHGVEHGQQLAHGGNDGDLGALAAFAQATVERLPTGKSGGQSRMVPRTLVPSACVLEDGAD